MKSLNSYQRGLLMTAIGVLILTPDALLIRLVETDHWTLVFWRSLFSAACLFILSAFIEKNNPVKAFQRIVKNGLLCALLFSGNNVFFVLSITHTTAANTLVILASMPFIGAVLTVVLLRKNMPLRTWLAIFLCMIGIVIVFWGRFGDGNIEGDIYALLTALCMAGTLVAVNFNPKIDTLAVIGLGCLLSALFALNMGASPLEVSSADLFYLFINGTVVFAIAMALITFGPKLIPAPEVSLVMLMETILGPLWVWLVFSEEPHRQTFIGGAIVITAILINAALGIRSSRSKKVL